MRSQNQTMEDLIHTSNLEFVSSLGLTLAYLVLLVISGVVGNTLVFLVYYKRFKPSVTRIYILAMSVCDLLINILALPSDIYEIRVHFDFDDDAGCKFFGYITRFLALFGAFTLIAIAVDRRRKICQSTRTPRQPKQVYVELTFLGVFALSYAIPFGILRGLQTIPIQGTNVTATTCSIADFYAGSLFFAIYNFSTGVTFIICVTIMSVCYALIARHLWHHKKRMAQNAKTKQDRERHQDPHRDTHEDGHTANKTKKFHGQRIVKYFTNTFSNERSEDEESEYKTSVGKLQITVTEDSEQSGTTSDLGNTSTSYNPQSSGATSSTMTDVSETESGIKQELESFSEDIIIEDAKPGIVDDTGNRNLEGHREAPIISHACEPHSHPVTTDDRPKLLKAKKSHSNKRGVPKSSKKIPGRTTLMMFVLTVLFVVSYLPYLSMAAIYRGKDIVGASYWVRNLHQIALRSFFINSAINPLVYSFCSVKFRQECRLFLCRK